MLARDRVLALLRESSDLTQSQIAEWLGLPLGTVKKAMPRLVAVGLVTSEWGVGADGYRAKLYSSAQGGDDGGQEV